MGAAAMEALSEKLGIEGVDVSVAPRRRRNEENSVCVTNLSEDTREPDLLELFGTFGAISHVHVAVDQRTGISRGFGFVNFVNKEDVERAIDNLNSYITVKVEHNKPFSHCKKERGERRE
ncbi:eukaryotic translation initiation factor 3 subunit G-like [Papaver somniferum]|uniref:eukaryotic translation initiation factor 3 subunit G-like n=1 Tax=Papaver somniferum TaxID=3469 RepID=UPI000E7003A4|nr:eukaryotic translation initiation factor 3 subunit G-like [Papaver somniferum]